MSSKKPVDGIPIKISLQSIHEKIQKGEAENIKLPA